MCPCFHPITAYQDIDSDKIYFYKPSDNLVNYKVLKLPCGKCIGCRKSRSTDWAVRCFHESKLHKQNCFLTLTFDDKKIKEYKQTHPLDNSVSEFMPVDLQMG